jgi:hypothetical protein
LESGSVFVFYGVFELVMQRNGQNKRDKNKAEGGIFSLICFTKEIGMGTLAPVEKRTIAQKTPQKQIKNTILFAKVKKGGTYLPRLAAIWHIYVAFSKCFLRS